MEVLARKNQQTGSQYESIVEAVKSDGRIRNMVDMIAQAERSKLTAASKSDNKPIEEADSIDKFINSKRAEMEAAKQRETEEKKKETLKSMINYNKVPHFVNAMNRFNEARLKKNNKFALFDAFAECSREAQNDIRIEQILDCWNALAVLTGEVSDTVATADEDVFGFSLDKTSSSIDEPWSVSVSKRSRKVLEQAYLKFIDRTLAQNPRETILGGKPTMVDRVKAFCAIRAKRLPPSEIDKIEVINGSAPWMLIFYLMRSGLFKEINEILITSSSQRSDPVLASFLKSFLDSPNHSMALQARAQVQAEFNQRQLQGPQDPFKMAILKIIGRCDLYKKTIPDLLQSSEDYLWLQLWLIRDDEPSNPSTYTLADLQRTICEFGPSYFSGSAAGRPGNPLNYFQMLLLTGQFEKSINSLLMTGYHLEAVHVAIGCLYKRRLQLSTSQSDGDNAVDFKALIKDYIQVIAADKSGELQYILSLTLHESLVPEAQAMVRQLVTSNSSDFVELLGDVLSDGRQQDGLIKHFAPLLCLDREQDFFTAIIVGSAERCTEEGRVVEALQLYNLSGEYERVYSVLNQQLAMAFVKPYNKEQCSQLTNMAQSIIDYYEQQPAIQAALASNHGVLQTACLLLLRVLSVRGFCEEGEWERALSSLSTLDDHLIPTTSDFQNVRAAAEKLTNTSADDHLPIIRSDLLLMTMNILYQCYRGLRRSTVIIDAGRQAQIDGLRVRARALLMLVGLLQGRVRVEASAEMARLEVLMV